MRKLFPIVLLSILISACNVAKTTKNTSIDIKEAELQISNVLDLLNSSAAKADYDTYFSLYSSDAVFTGTDANERWDNAAFKIWAKPIFAKGRAWSFTALERNIYVDPSGKFAWFDELLNTQMKICRGSGVLVKENNTWKLKQYILSTTIPNEEMDNVVKIKSPIEDKMIKELSKN